MKIPAIKGLIWRRILLNYRVAPDVVQKVLPSNFRPKLVGGYSIVGICLIRSEQIRPKGMPPFTGISSENSAHRIAVEWNDPACGVGEGVFVSRRDTDSRLNALAGGRIFPGVHHLSKFTDKDKDGCISLQVDAEDTESPLIGIKVTENTRFPSNSIFATINESSQFFESGCVGYSSRPNSCRLDGLLLDVKDWRVSSLRVDNIRSAYFDDQALFPSANIEFDHALLMRDIPHEWYAEPTMTTEETTVNKP